MHDVFLSYSNHDKPSADAVCHGLESQGIRCFIAPRDMTPVGWSGQITQAIRASKVFVLIFSENSNASDSVESEVSVAVQARLHIVNFRLEAVDPSPDLELHLRKRHWLDAIKPLQKAHIDQLAVAIEKLIGPPVTPPTEMPTPPATDGTEVKRPCGDSASVGSPSVSAGVSAAPPQWTISRRVAVGTVVVLLAGAVGWSLRKPGQSDRSFAPWKVQVLTPAGDPIESGKPVLARRQQGTTTWGDGRGGVHEAENYVQFTLQMKSVGGVLPGPFMVHFFLKEEGATGRLRLDDTIAPGMLVVAASPWKEQGYTRAAAWRILDEKDAAPVPAATDKDKTFVFSPNLIVGKDGYLAHGIHEIGIEVEDAAKNIVYRGTLNLDVWETDPRDHLLEWIQEGDASGVPSKRIKSYPSTDANGKTTDLEADLEYAYQFRNVSAKTIGQIQMTTWFNARRPTESPDPSLIVATSALAWVRAPGSTPPPQGFTAGNAFLIPEARLVPGDLTPTLAGYLGMGRGGWIPGGNHELAVELWADGALGYRGFHSVQVPPGPAQPGLELLDSEGKPIPPNGVLNAEVSQKYKNVPNSGSHFEVALFLDLRYQASGIGPEHQSSKRSDGYGDLTWLIFLPENLRSHPETRRSAAPFQLGDFNGPETLWCQGNEWGVLEPGDTAPKPLTLAFPLDPSLPQTKEGQPGLWVKEGDHRVRLLAILRGQNLDRYPDPKAILFQRDFTLRVSQPQPIVLGGRP